MEPDTRWLLAWIGVGLLLAFGVLAIFSIGFPFLLAGLIAGLALIRRRGADRALIGLLMGIGLVLLFIAALNHDYQPCSASHGVSFTLKPGQTSAEYQCGGLNPVPTAIAGGSAILVGLLSTVVLRRRGRNSFPAS